MFEYYTFTALLDLYFSLMKILHVVQQYSIHGIKFHTGPDSTESFFLKILSCCTFNKEPTKSRVQMQVHAVCLLGLCVYRMLQV